MFPHRLVLSAAPRPAALAALIDRLTGTSDAQPGYVLMDPAPRAPRPYDRARRDAGDDVPVNAPTMIGRVRLRHLASLVERVIADGVPGDVVEAGVWRGGACIMMRWLLARHGVRDRIVWIADSFAGMPLPDPRFWFDQHYRWHEEALLRVPLHEVQENFAAFDLLDDQVKFLPGFFADTLPSAPIERLAILRVDCDMEGGTRDVLAALHHRVAPGGFVIIDDYCLLPCMQAVVDFRTRHRISWPIESIDGRAVFWRVGAPSGAQR
jgi:hypothetical protein